MSVALLLLIRLTAFGPAGAASFCFGFGLSSVIRIRNEPTGLLLRNAGNATMDVDAAIRAAADSLADANEVQ